MLSLHRPQLGNDLLLGILSLEMVNIRQVLDNLVCFQRLAVNDAESSSGHEDDALFGDLFSEANRKVVISDGHE